MPMPTRGGKHGAEERVVVIERPEKQRASKERAASRPLNTTGADAAASSGRLVPMRQLHAAWLKEQLHASNDAADADGILSAFIMRKQSRRWQPGSKLQPAMRGLV